MVYVDSQLKVLRLLQAGKTVEQIAEELKRKRTNIVRSIRALCNRDNIKDINELINLLSVVVLPERPPVKHGAGIRQTKYGSWEVKVFTRGLKIDGGAQPSRRLARQRQKEILADIDGFLEQRSKRPRLPQYIYRRTNGNLRIRIYSAIERRTVHVGTRRTLEEAIALRDEYLAKHNRTAV